MQIGSFINRSIRFSNVLLILTMDWREKKKKDTMGVQEEGYFLPSGLNKLLWTHPKLDTMFRSFKWGPAGPKPWLVFEMMFTVFGLQSLLDTFNQFLS